jgi:hypothetical protein
MAKGDLTRALRQTGGLDPVVESLRNIFQQKAQQDYYNNLLGAYDKANKKIKNLSSAPKSVKAVFNNLSSLVKSKQQQNPLTELNNEQAQDISNNFTSDQMIGAIKTPGSNTSIVNALSGLIDNTVQKHNINKEPKTILPAVKEKITNNSIQPGIVNIKDIKGIKFYTKEQIKNKYPNLYHSLYEGDIASKEKGFYIRHTNKSKDNPEGIEAVISDELSGKKEKSTVSKITGRTKRKVNPYPR